MWQSCQPQSGNILRCPLAHFYSAVDIHMAQFSVKIMCLTGSVLGENQQVTDEMIADRWAKGESAANEMRQAEEEWLLGIARGFGVNVRIRPLEKAYSYERSELASAIGGFLSDLKLTPAVSVRPDRSYFAFHGSRSSIRLIL